MFIGSFWQNLTEYENAELSLHPQKDANVKPIIFNTLAKHTLAALALLLSFTDADGL